MGFLGLWVVAASIVSLFLPKYPKNSTEHRLSTFFFVVVHNFPMTAYVLWDMYGIGGRGRPSWDFLLHYYFVWNIIIFLMMFSLRYYEKFSLWHTISMILCAIAMFFNIAFVIYSRIP
jgi:hypothetical protein